MNTNEIATGTPDRALLRPAFSVRPSGTRGLSKNTNRAYHPLSSAEQLCPAFQQAQPRA
ncbi:hypothetical protein [Cellulomonas sp. Leaf334]|uniref:hypothetical protein n=1 Tax=Cellulomonas sp. Leaf334 TaxID=1736339 RepID=UPI000A81FC47|nr:hypothetical protein [Cellulomonas sp. Leaf334]